MTLANLRRLLILAMSPLKKTLLIGFVLFSCVGCDQVTKDAARDHLRYAPSVTLLAGSVHLVYAENPGAAFSLGARLPEQARFLLFTVGAAVILIGVGAFSLLRCGRSKTCLAATALVLGGGIGNLMDRILNEGRVIDFIMVRFGEVQTAVFNVADVFILVGTAMLVHCLSQERRGHDDDTNGNGTV